MEAFAVRENNTLDLAKKLSAREKEVLTLVSLGLTSSEVAEKLFVCKRTVEYHLSSIYNKLMVDNRLQACRKATWLGIIKDEAPAKEQRKESHIDLTAVYEFPITTG